MATMDGTRADPMEYTLGGYNALQDIIVCDIALPGGQPTFSVADEESPSTSAPCESPMLDEVSSVADAPDVPLLCFGPPIDPDFVRDVLPQLRERFDVDFVDSTDEGLQQVASGRPYVVCVSKSGTEGNFSYPFLQALRDAHGAVPFIAIHSATAAHDDQLAVNLVVPPGATGEAELMAKLAPYGRS